MKTHKWIRLSLLVVILFATISCGILNPGPGKTVQSFFKALDKGEINEAMEYLSVQTIQTLGYDKWRTALAEAANSLASSGGIKSVKIMNEDIIGDTARVTFEVELKNGETEIDTFELVKENDEWKIVVDLWQK